MKFDEQGRIVWTPQELYQMAEAAPNRLLTGYLMAGTPWAFPDHACYCDFLEAVAERTGVHPRNLYLRGSCHIGFSIAPKSDKVWVVMEEKSDLDLVIVDAPYFQRFEEEIRRWESRNPIRSPQDRGAPAAARRAQDRQFNCCRDEGLPTTVCIHHRKTMDRVARMAHCGCVRHVSAFLYPDWHSAQARYEYDLRQLREGVAQGWLTPAPATPLPRERAAARGPVAFGVERQGSIPRSEPGGPTEQHPERPLAEPKN